MDGNRIYIAIDLKSFYASVECAERGLDPLNANLVVADTSRTEKTICLAVSPALKRYGIPGRARLFEVIQKVNEVNADRRISAPEHVFSGKSHFASELDNDKSLELDFIAATPRMALYMDYSTRIYNIYLKYIAPEDIHVYSVDEVFMDVTAYLRTYRMTARELAMKMIRDVLQTTGITATAGIGTNLYLCKIAMDIVAKHMPADKDGVRIAELDEKTYRQLLWEHRPLTDFWRIGGGISRRLEQYGIFTMGDVARCSLGGENEYYNEALLYKLFGVGAELLIDHAWGWEPVTMAEIKAYRPETRSLSTGQVLPEPYNHRKALLVIKEMTDMLVLDMVEKRIVTNQITIQLGYDIENLQDPERAKHYHGEVKSDHYGRPVPKHAHGSYNLPEYTSSTKTIMNAATELFMRIADPKLTVRRLNVIANNVITDSEWEKKKAEMSECEQLDIFTDYGKADIEKKEKERLEKREKNIQNAIIGIRKKYGNNAVLKGMNFEEGGTAIERNGQIGGHKA